MTLSPTEFWSIAGVVFAIFMTGTLQLKRNVYFFSLQSLMIGIATISYWFIAQDIHFIYLGAAIICVKVLGVSLFLIWILRAIDIRRDGSTFLPVPLAMHTSILLLGVSHILSLNLPKAPEGITLAGNTTAGVALLLIGILFMLTRKTAISQIIGFLTLENGIYLFTLSLAHGMPMAVELGVLLDVLVAVMLAGVITFRISKSFEHIDTTQLKDLTE